MVIALAFVPTDGLEQAIDNLAGHLPDELQPLLDWFEDSYVGRRNRQGGIVHGDSRTNSYTVAAPSSLKAELGMANLTIWKLTDSLRKVQVARDLVYEQLDAGHQPQKN
ncbi:hypothetical protein T11_632 [Trichinella zimbabwensis]|uniref:Uncharacterized protein n=1 Tax=Trichinella zimbabwensis TaxID=268475 RepID=A0A0V1GYB6_9BILA|nr:hypothetical protein T11_632 [Trichinella zimbabwensis]